MWGARCKAARLACLLAAQSCVSASWLAGLRPASARGAHRLMDAEAVAAKRERRKQRRHANRELRERVGVHSCGWQLMRPPQARASHPAARHAASATEAAGSMQEVDDWELFQAVLGKPRNATERRKFATVWKQWQAASSRSGSSSSTWEEDREGSSRAESSSSSSRSNTKGSAGASAGPRWGQASWSWADFRQEEASSRSSSSGGGWQSRSSGFGSSGWGDEEAWYEPPRSSSSSRRKASRGDPWGWHSSWQQDSRSWQHGSGSVGNSSSSSSTWSSIQLLGLERSWLSLRCGRLLKKAYLAKAKALHPDVHAGSNASTAAAAEARFKEVQAAYEALLALVPPAQ